jgi:hypothetical protein
MAAETLIEEIKQRAYEIWLSEGCPPGRERIHWVRAEAEFRERLFGTPVDRFSKQRPNLVRRHGLALKPL